MILWGFVGGIPSVGKTLALSKMERVATSGGGGDGYSNSFPGISPNTIILDTKMPPKTAATKREQPTIVGGVGGGNGGTVVVEGGSGGGGDGVEREGAMVQRNETRALGQSAPLQMETAIKQKAPDYETHVTAALQQASETHVTPALQQASETHATPALQQA
ncbi:hypothetical protein CYMTET_5424, partial [Cymbomonas tetramitiformis]